jgi:hypothetical protein
VIGPVCDRLWISQPRQAGCEPALRQERVKYPG